MGNRLILSTTVLFDTDRARVRHYARPALVQLAAMLQAHAGDTRVRIEGHADVRGDAAYNQWLSQVRAERVAAVLIAAGVAAAQIETVGFGSAQPRAAGDDLATHARNRRVEFVLLDATRPAATEAP